MKRGTIEHPKTETLADLLAIPLAQAVGHLEALWHFVARFTRRGDVGRYPDKMIARRALWVGDPSTFIEALIAAEWLDRCSVARLVVHDWHDHVDTTTKKALERAGETIAVPVPFSNPLPSQHFENQFRKATDQYADKPAAADRRPACGADGGETSPPSSEVFRIHEFLETPSAKGVRGCPTFGGQSLPKDCLPEPVPEPLPSPEKTEVELVRSFWGAAGRPEHQPAAKELSFAAELVARHGIEVALELAAKVSAKVRGSGWQLRWMQGAKTDFDVLAISASRLDADRRRRAQETIDRRRAAERGEEQRKDWDRLRVRMRKRWECLPLDVREKILAEIRLKFPLLADKETLLLDQVYLRLNHELTTAAGVAAPTEPGKESPQA